MPDTLNNRIKKANELFDGSYNCSQSVAAAFGDKLNIKDEDLFRLMSGFGYGMGGERSVCGAVSGGIFVISSSIEDPTQREEIYDKVYYLIDGFKRMNNGQLNCLDLVGEEPTEENFRSICPVLIEQVIQLVNEILESPK